MSELIELCVRGCVAWNSNHATKSAEIFSSIRETATLGGVFPPAVEYGLSDARLSKQMPALL